MLQRPEPSLRTACLAPPRLPEGRRSPREAALVGLVTCVLANQVAWRRYLVMEFCPGGDMFDQRPVHIVGVATKVVSKNWLKVTLWCCLRPRVQKFQFVELPEAFACFVS